MGERDQGGLAEEQNEQSLLGLPDIPLPRVNYGRPNKAPTGLDRGNAAARIWSDPYHAQRRILTVVRFCLYRVGLGFAFRENPGGTLASEVRSHGRGRAHRCGLFILRFLATSAIW